MPTRPPPPSTNPRFMSAEPMSLGVDVFRGLRLPERARHHLRHIVARPCGRKDLFAGTVFVSCGHTFILPVVSQCVSIEKLGDVFLTDAPLLHECFIKKRSGRSCLQYKGATSWHIEVGIDV